MPLIDEEGDLRNQSQMPRLGWSPSVGGDFACFRIPGSVVLIELDVFRRAGLPPVDIEKQQTDPTDMLSAGPVCCTGSPICN